MKIEDHKQKVIGLGIVFFPPFFNFQLNLGKNGSTVFISEKSKFIIKK